MAPDDEPRSKPRDGARRAAPRPQPGVFVGRAAVVDRLLELVRTGERLVTVTGVAGIGKTRVARELVVRAAADGPGAGSVLFCDATEARSADELCGALGRTLGVRLFEGDHAAVTDQLGRALDARGPALLVLDNLEQLVEPAAEALARWLELAPGAQWVVTSREVLRLPGEFVFELPPLGLADRDDQPATSDAACLLRELVERARGGAPVAPGELHVYSEIARQLEGIPLAIELAAARISVLGAAAVLARLANRFELLNRGARAAAGHGRTLRQTLDWSWELLEPPERAALLRCSVFRGGFGLEAAEAVLGRDAIEHVQALREKSLLRALPPGPSGESRFGVYVTVRDYAAERLATSGERPAIERRHAEYYARQGERWADAVGGRGGRASLARLTLERENLVAAAERALDASAQDPGAAATALRAVLALDPVVWAHGPLDGHLALFDRVLAAATAAQVEPALCAAGLVARGDCRRRRGLADRGQADHAAALEIARREGDRRMEGRALKRLATALFDRGEGEQAAAVWTEALAAHRESGDARYEGMTLSDLAAVAGERGDLVTARDLSTAALAANRAEGNAHHEAIVLTNLGLIALTAGTDAEARGYFEQALAIHRESGNAFLEATVLVALGAAEHVGGDLALAAEYYDRGVALGRGVGDSRFEGVYEGYHALVDFEAGRLEQAAARLGRAVAILREGGPRAYLPIMSAYLAGVEAARGRVESAEGLLASASSSADAGGDTPLATVLGLQRVHLALALARAASERGDAESARDHERAARDALSAAERASRDAFGEPAARWRSLDGRLAMRLARAALAPSSESQDASEELATPRLVVHCRGEWFRLATGARVDCRSRKTLARLLAGLVAQRRDAPGTPLSKSALIALGWPGERIPPELADQRLRVLLTHLRQLGLRGLLVARPDGYLLDPAVPTQVVEEVERPSDLPPSRGER